LIVVIGYSHDRTKYSLCDEGTASCVGHVQNLFLNLRRKPQQAHDLCHPGPGDPFVPGDFGLIYNLARLQESLPFDRLAEEFGHPVGSDGDFEGLFAEVRHRDAFFAILSEMNDLEPDLRVRLAVSRPAHSRSQRIRSGHL